MISELIIEEVKYYVENDNVTKIDVAHKFNRSVSSVKKDFAKFREYVLYNPGTPYEKLYLLEQKKSIINEHSGKIKGGESNNSGKKPLSVTKVLEIAKYIKQSNCTLQDASIKFEIPKSTIYENIEKIKNSDDAEIVNIYNSIQTIYSDNRNRNSRIK